ncbi:hypothetical protein BDR22DRAFT_970450 [Usnea florida]
MSRSNAPRYPNSMVKKNVPVAPSNINGGRSQRLCQPSNMGRFSYTPSKLGMINEASSKIHSTTNNMEKGLDDDNWEKEDNLYGPNDQQNLVASMKALEIDGSRKAQLRAPECEWRKSSVGSFRTLGRERQQRQKANNWTAKPNPPTMSLADHRQVYTFPQNEFERGMIFRAALHEEDYTASGRTAFPPPSDMSFLAASNMSTASALPKNHQIMTDFGPVYSENRYMVVVVLGPDTYTALPFFTHSGNGTAHKNGKTDYVSIQDHRDLGKCIPQSEHKPVCTQELKDNTKTLHEFTTANLGIAVSRKYRLPIAYHGKLNDKDTDRLVELFKTWIMKH